MKIGIISDIHAVFKPLEYALQIFDREGVDQIVCAGDLVHAGMDVNPVVDYLRAGNIPCVQGNHDIEVLAEPWRENDPNRRYPFTWETYQFVVTLPEILHFEWEGKRICLAHGAPWACWQYVYADSDPHIIRRVVDEAQSDIVILGHTHIPMQVYCQKTYILNAGSVAMNRDHLHGRTCGILQLPDFNFRIFDLGSGDARMLETQFIS